MPQFFDGPPPQGITSVAQQPQFFDGPPPEGAKPVSPFPTDAQRLATRNSVRMPEAPSQFQDMMNANINPLAMIGPQSWRDALRVTPAGVAKGGSDLLHAGEQLAARWIDPSSYFRDNFMTKAVEAQRAEHDKSFQNNFNPNSLGEAVAPAAAFAAMPEMGLEGAGAKISGALGKIGLGAKAASVLGKTAGWALDKSANAASWTALEPVNYDPSQGETYGGQKAKQIGEYTLANMALGGAIEGVAHAGGQLQAYRNKKGAELSEIADRIRNATGTEPLPGDILSYNKSESLDDVSNRKHYHRNWRVLGRVWARRNRN